MEYPENHRVFWFTKKILKCGFQQGHTGPYENEASGGYTSSTPLNEACYTISYSMPAERLNIHKKVKNGSHRDALRLSLRDSQEPESLYSRVQNKISALLYLKLHFSPKLDSCQSCITIFHSSMREIDNRIIQVYLINDAVK